MKTYLKYVSFFLIFLLFGCAHVPENLYLKPLFQVGGYIEVYKVNGVEVFKTNDSVKYQMIIGVSCSGCEYYKNKDGENYYPYETEFAISQDSSDMWYSVTNNLANKNEIGAEKKIKFINLVKNTIYCNKKNKICKGINSNILNQFLSTAIFKNQTWNYEFDSHYP